jgi:hypothetical protein
VLGALFAIEHAIIGVCLFLDARDLILHVLGRPFPGSTPVAAPRARAYINSPDPMATASMPLPPPRVTHLQDELVTQAVALLQQNTRASRLAAMQILARGYAIDEQSRLAALGEE